jgi:hypothetical protein
LSLRDQMLAGLRARELAGLPGFLPPTASQSREDQCIRWVSFSLTAAGQPRTPTGFPFKPLSKRPEAPARAATYCGAERLVNPRLVVWARFQAIGAMQSSTRGSGTLSGRRTGRRGGQPGGRRPRPTTASPGARDEGLDHVGGTTTFDAVALGACPLRSLRGALSVERALDYPDAVLDVEEVEKLHEDRSGVTCDARGVGAGDRLARAPAANRELTVAPGSVSLRRVSRATGGVQRILVSTPCTTTTRYSSMTRRSM